MALNDKYLLSHVFSFLDEENRFWASNVCKTWTFLYDRDSITHWFISSPGKLDIAFDQKNVNTGWLLFYSSYYERGDFDLHEHLLDKIYSRAKLEGLDEETRFAVFENLITHVNTPFYWFEINLNICVALDFHTTLPDFSMCILEECLHGNNMQILAYMNIQGFFDRSFLIENSGFISTICAKYNFVDILEFLMNQTGNIDYVIVLETASINGNTNTVQWTFAQIKRMNLVSDEESYELKRCVLLNSIKTYDFLTSYWLFESTPTLRISLKFIMDILSEDLETEDFNVMFWNFFFEISRFH